MASPTMQEPHQASALAGQFIESLRPRLSAITTQMDAGRRLPTPLVEEMRQAGLFKLLAPRDLGGAEMDPIEASRIVEDLSRLDGSLGWLSMIASQSAWFLAFTDRDAAQEILGAPGDSVAGALKPGGKAVPTATGYRVSGRWPLASGCTHASWLYATCLVEKPSADGQGAPPELRVVYIPASKADILDTWHTSGLRGTGSHDFTLADVEVPATHSFPFPVFGAPWADSPLYRCGNNLINLVFILQAAQAIGTATGAFDAFKELAAVKTRWSSSSPLATEGTIRAQTATLYAGVQSARAWLYSVAGETWDAIVDGQEPTMEQRMRLRLAITHAISTSVDAGRSLHDMAGSAAIYDGHPVGRAANDLQMAAAHVQAAPAVYQLTGGFLLGDESISSPALI